VRKSMECISFEVSSITVGVACGGANGTNPETGSKPQEDYRDNLWPAGRKHVQTVGDLPERPGEQRDVIPSKKSKQK
jgi:hypothetical protein